MRDDEIGDVGAGAIFGFVAGLFVGLLITFATAQHYRKTAIHYGYATYDKSGSFVWLAEKKE